MPGTKYPGILIVPIDMVIEIHTKACIFHRREDAIGEKKPHILGLHHAVALGPDFQRV